MLRSGDLSIGHASLLYLYSTLICVVTPRVDDYHRSTLYVFYQTTLLPLPDIAVISILSSFRSTRVFSLHLPYSYILPTLATLPHRWYLPVSSARVSHFCSYDSDLFCYLLSTILRTFWYIPRSLTRLLCLLRSVSL